MKSHFTSFKKRLCCRLAPSLLLIAAATAARADGDLIDYRDTVRYYDGLTSRGSAAPQRPAAVRIGYLHLSHRPVTRVIVTADLPKPVPNSGCYIAYPNAEDTGAAQGQTVNRATNDLN